MADFREARPGGSGHLGLSPMMKGRGFQSQHRVPLFILVILSRAAEPGRKSATKDLLFQHNCYLVILSRATERSEGAR